MNKIPKEYRKFLYLGIVAVLAVWIFCTVLVISYKLERKLPATEPSSDIMTATLPSETETTEDPFSTETTVESTGESSTESTETLSIGGNNFTTTGEYSVPSEVSESISVSQSEYESVSEKEATRVAVPSGKAEIVQAYVDAVNKLKNTENFTVMRTEEFEASIDSITGGSAVEGIVNKIIENNTDSSPKTFNFVNGNDSATGTSPNAEIAPANSAASLSASDVKSASVQKNDNGGFTVTIELGEDEQTLTQPAKVYSSCMDTLSLSDLGLTSSMTVSTLNLTYSDGKIVAVIDSGGRITAMTHTLNVKKASGSGRITLINVSLEMHGSNREMYRISYK